MPLTYVEIFTDDIYEVEYDESDTVLQFKQRLFHEYGIPVAAQRLVYAGILLQDHRVLHGYGISEGGYLNLAQPLPIENNDQERQDLDAKYDVASEKTKSYYEAAFTVVSDSISKEIEYATEGATLQELTAIVELLTLVHRFLYTTHTLPPTWFEPQSEFRLLGNRILDLVKAGRHLVTENINDSEYLRHMTRLIGKMATDLSAAAALVDASEDFVYGSSSPAESDFNGYSYKSSLTKSIQDPNRKLVVEDTLDYYFIKSKSSPELRNKFFYGLIVNHPHPSLMARALLKFKPSQHDSALLRGLLLSDNPMRYSPEASFSTPTASSSQPVTAVDNNHLGGRTGSVPPVSSFKGSSISSCSRTFFQREPAVSEELPLYSRKYYELPKDMIIFLSEEASKINKTRKGTITPFVLWEQSEALLKKSKIELVLEYEQQRPASNQPRR